MSEPTPGDFAVALVQCQKRRLELEVQHDALVAALREIDAVSADVQTGDKGGLKLNYLRVLVQHTLLAMGEEP